MNEPTLEIEGTQDLQPGDAIEWMFVRLQSPVTLMQRHRDDTQKRGYTLERLKLDVGEVVAITHVDDDPRNHTPIRCTHPDWSSFFWLGKNHEIFRQWVVIQRDARGRAVYISVDPPETGGDETPGEAVPSTVDELVADQHVELDLGSTLSPQT